MKRLLAITLAGLLLFSGCKSNTKDNNSYYNDGSTNITFQTEFNEEEYVWEYFIFSTNRVENAK